MKPYRWLFLSLILFACQPQMPPSVTILDGGQIQTIQTDERIPLAILTQAGMTLNSNDRILINGIPVAPEQPVPKTDSITLQIRRATTLTINSAQGNQVFESAAFTVGEALNDAGIQLYNRDLIDPPPDAFILNPFTINLMPSREYSVYVGGQTITIRSSAGIVGEILASAGIPLIGLDSSVPSEFEAPPPDGQIRIVRVSESILIALTSIPFPTETKQTDQLELGQQEIIQPGINGLAITRTRIRYEDGKEVSRRTESKIVTRPPQARIVNAGTKLVSHSLGELQYWYAIQMYATSYSPCRSGISGCSYGTASGMPMKRGVVAMSKDWYYALQGMQVYVPGYGIGVVGDMGGGFPDGRAWIDLGYNDNDYQPWSEWVTVYFIGPAPAVIPSILGP